ncbi:urease accessory protein UreF [Streptosporangium sp. NBC_01495]|uniref:urease accessory protein UreF n=1 Tax=Streptosporangium sp. NBC_01495 TaxID=2903899 RepID=UPI002E35D303|nr:urease accessory UreF family protein [Streptosporangium sp. NBC_01495]
MLLLADSRLPAGGHAHSGGAEEAVRIGAIHDLPGLAAFLRGRLATAGLVTAALAAAACELGAAHLSASLPPPASGPPAEVPARANGVAPAPRHGPAPANGSSPDPETSRSGWIRLDAEADARISSPAQRVASRTQGRLLLRTSRRIWPSPVLDASAGAVSQGVHHPLALGAVAAVAGCSPAEAALAAAYTSVTGPATAAVRLLGLDPVAVHRLLADLAPAMERVAATVTTGESGKSRDSPDSWESLPAHAAPALDLLAEQHIRADLRLFVS